MGVSDSKYWVSWLKTRNRTRNRSQWSNQVRIGLGIGLGSPELVSLRLEIESWKGGLGKLWNVGPITCLIFVDVCHIIIRILQKFGARKAQHAVWRDSNVLQRRQASFEQNRIFYSMGNRKTSVHAFQRMWTHCTPLNLWMM